MDDSTELVYGPTTSRYMFERDLRHSDTLYHHIDTAIHNLERFEFKDKTETIYQDLGNNGTAMRPIYYAESSTIGRTTGFESYTPYVKQVNDFKYYDTKSPFMELNVAFGGKGRNVVDFSFSRNINAQWNIGFDVHKISAFKLIGSSSLRETQISGTGVDLYTFHSSKNSKYHLMFHAYKFEHKATESGGIFVEDDAEERDFFQYQDSDVFLRTAASYDTRTRLHLYQEYSVAEFFEVYAVASRINIENRFEDTQLTTVDAQGTPYYYDDFLIRTDSTLDASLFNEWRVEAGLKGRVGKRIFYSGYVKRRDIDFNYRYLDTFGHTAENYLGGDIKLYVTKSNALSGKIEVMDGGQYYFSGRYENNFLRAQYTSRKYLPSYMSERYFGNHNEWSNSFEDILSNTISGSLFHAFSFVRLEPEVKISTIDNYVYFGEDKLPAQNSAVALVNNYSLRSDFFLGKHFKLENKVIFNNVAGDGADAIRTPDWNYMGKWYYDNIIFNNYMEMQLGVNLRWQSAYFANAYDPVTQQFYVQNEFEASSFWTADLFFVMKAQKLSLWAKFKYLNQKKEDGYFETPYYPATRKMIDLGLRWHFYD
ncbi:putative porin [Reichenbachiella faecimaris]|uniref:putative porin n=1 Tax=Reichenbachiella faecimaris TaxID=692418 RepID=UPI000A00EAF6|nr:putative porin [Reichenbachiella faecimaris]